MPFHTDRQRKGFFASRGVIKAPVTPFFQRGGEFKRFEIQQNGSRFFDSPEDLPRREEKGKRFQKIFLINKNTGKRIRQLA